MHYIDITGQRFGKLVAQTCGSPDRQGNMLWHCTCDCGRTLLVSGTNLRQGRQKSCGQCGSLRLIDLTGQRFGRLVVIKRSTQRSANGNALWQCRCDCGKQVVVDSQRLRKHITRSCGCLRNELAKKRSYHNAAFRKTQGNISRLKDANGVFFCSTKKTKRNRTGVIGVSFDQHSGRYVARLRYRGQYVLNQTAATLQEAATLRHRAELKYFKPSTTD